MWEQLWNPCVSIIVGLNDSMSGGMQLLPDPLFSIPTDNTYILSITSTDLGRIFMAGKDGCLYEIAYQAEAGWLSQRCRKINHSKSSLSFLVPSVLQFSFSEDGEREHTLTCSGKRRSGLIKPLQKKQCFLFSSTDPIVQIAIDNSRNTLFTRSEKGVLQVWHLWPISLRLVDFQITSKMKYERIFYIFQVYDLGADGQGMSRVATMSQSSIVAAAGNIARYDFMWFTSCVFDFFLLLPFVCMFACMINRPSNEVRLFFIFFPPGQLIDLSSSPLSRSLSLTDLSPPTATCLLLLMLVKTLVHMVLVNLENAPMWFLHFLKYCFFFV